MGSLGWHYAQPSLDYTPLSSRLPIPKDFKEHTLSKIHTSKKKTKKNFSKRKQKARAKVFIEESNFWLDELLFSGKVLFNDTLSKYCTSIAHYILEKNNLKHLQKDIRFYTLKSNQTNAFATNQGSIFITLGLLSRVENESELAFVIAHEMAHYMEKHVLGAYLSKEDTFHKKKRKKLNYEDVIRSVSQYSQKQELEADSIGFELLEKTSYNLDSILGVFDLLGLSHVPIENKVISYDYLDLPHAIIPGEHFLDTVQRITPYNNQDDEFHSHPNLSKRKDKIIGKRGDKEKQSEHFIIAKNQNFKQYQRIARLESIRTDLLNKKYISALYSIHSLPNLNANHYSQICKAKALYGYAKLKNYNALEPIEHYTNIQGEAQQLYFLFHRLDAEQLNVISIAHIFPVLEKHPDHIYLKKIITDLINDLKNIHNLALDDFVKLEQVDSLKALIDRKDDNIKKDLPADKIVKASEKESIRNDFLLPENFHLFAFAHLIENEMFKALFNVPDSNKALNQEVPIKDIIILDPLYYKANKKRELDLVKSEQQQIAYNKIIENCASKAKVNYITLSSKNKQSSIDQINQMALTKEWIQELQPDQIKNFIPSCSDEMSQLNEELNAHHIYMSLATAADIKKIGGLIWAPYIFMVPNYGLDYAFQRKTHLNLYNYLINTQNCTIERYDERYLKHPDNPGILKSHIYDYLHSINKKK